jgi:hypothetical protein
MAKVKFDFYNIDIKLEDIRAMEDFINLYDDCQDKIKQFNAKQEELMKDKKIAEKMKNTDNNIIEAVQEANNDMMDEFIQSNDEETRKKLKIKIDEYNNELSELRKFDKISELFYSEIYSDNLSKYFNNEGLEEKIEKYTKEKYPSYNKEELDEQIKIEKELYLRKEKSTITRVYLNIKYLYEVSLKIYESKKNEPKKNGIFTKIKNAIKKYKLKKNLKKYNKEYQEENEVNISNIDKHEHVYTIMEDLEKDTEFYKMFKEPIKLFVNDKKEKIKEAVNETLRLPKEFEIGKNITILTESKKREKQETEKEKEIIIDENGIVLSKEEQIKRLKELKKELEKEHEHEPDIPPKKVA